MNPITRTRFKDTCFIPLHPHYNILSDILRRHQYALDSHKIDKRLGLSKGFAKEGDIIVIIYRDMFKYSNKNFHACRAHKNDEYGLVIDGFNKTPGTYTLDYFSDTRVRVLSDELEPLRNLLVDHIAPQSFPEPIIPIPPSL